MRVKEMADLAGTTTRTVRHYHALGLLPVPAARGLQRDYGFEHLARLMRIRWLAASGLSLDRVAQILDEEDSANAPQTDSLLTDLQATRAGLDERIEELKHQRRRIERLIDLASSGVRLSPLPESIERFCEDLESRMTRPTAIRLLRNEMHAMTALSALSDFTSTAVNLYLTDFDEQERAVIAELFERFAALRDLDPQDRATLAIRNGVIEDMWALIERHKRSSRDFLRALPGSGLSTRLWTAWGPLVRIAYPDPVQRVVLAELLRRIAADPILSGALEADVRKEWLDD
ncbi:MAG: MerR family transcriptional regulator [Schaalia hyovaginalis]|uniref:MerR family transcriptional regulator n=1 Tax=Schaalia hyovaginalis TaxID=29316 RepID=UPI002A910540|nr:MerR family transcriptional regulator [Schaalia hyovaginalis]MDY6213582.1 MerR family transcriptional regulator [Schaalia hyovaginalis]